MSKIEQNALLVSPEYELKFEGPFNLPVTSWIQLTNNTEKKVYFKLKTTAPKKYCVRPNSGFITPKSVVEVQVLLQPFTYNAAEKNKHKFMIQSLIVPDGSVKTAEELWKTTDQDSITSYKLKCVFEYPQSANQKQAVEPEEQQEFFKAPPPKAPLFGVSGELQKVASDVKQWREEESKLRQENIALKEEILRLRKEKGDSPRHSYSPPVAQPAMESPVSIPFIAVSVIVVVFAFLLGKFIL